MNHSQIVSFIWGVADLIRDLFKRGKYQDVILPLTVLRRLDCVLAPTKRKVLEVQARFAGRIDNLDPQLRRASGFAFYNCERNWERKFCCACKLFIVNKLRRKREVRCGVESANFG